MSTADDAPTTECSVLHRHYGVRSWITFNPPVGTKDGDDECGCDSTSGICCHDSDHCYCVEEGHTE